MRFVARHVRYCVQYAGFCRHENAAPGYHWVSSDWAYLCLTSSNVAVSSKLSFLLSHPFPRIRECVWLLIQIIADGSLVFLIGNSVSGSFRDTKPD